MRVMIQRVSQAEVSVDGHIIGHIGEGLLIFVGFETGDRQEDFDWICHKVINLRIFKDEFGRMNRSVLDVNGNILLVSQFTLWADVAKGHRPSFVRAASPEDAKKWFDIFHAMLEVSLDRSVPTGKFGADMKVACINDGPVTIWMDSKQKDL